jgi:membrane-bound lytic murein transglycosylase B
MKRLPRLNLCTFLILLQLIITHHIHAKDFHPAFQKLVSRLQKDGIDKQYLRDIFTRSELELMPETVAKSLVRKEAGLNYAQFLEKYAVNKSISYLKTHERSLKKIEGYFGVSAPVVVAILCVETACGTYLGRVNAVNLLVTQALSLEPDIYQQIYNQIPSEEKALLSHQKIKEKLGKKSDKGYRELKALFTYAKGHDIDTFTIQGSAEGAIGIPQFLPSNINKYGFDGNGDGKINLFQHEDAIASVASFLKAYRWSEERSYQKKKGIIRRYNPSDYYASTVLQLAEMLMNYWH